MKTFTTIALSTGFIFAANGLVLTAVALFALGLSAPVATFFYSSLIH